MDNISNDNFLDFLSTIKKPSQKGLGQLERQARNEGIPIIRPESWELLSLLLRLKKPKKILEIGTAIGYSALMMEASLDDASIITIERNPIMYKEAEKNFKKYRAKNIRLVKDDAINYIKETDEEYDFIFLDGAKGQYVNYLPYLVSIMSNGAILFADNILQDGLLLKSNFALARRQRTIHKRLKEYLYQITHRDDLDTTVLSLEDGVAISIKNSKA